MAEGNLRRKEWNKRNENERGNERIKTEMEKKNGLQSARFLP